MKFGTCTISSMSISIFMSIIIFKKYLPPVRPKLIPKLKILNFFSKIICKFLANVRPNCLVHSIFQICQSKFWCQKWFLWNIYLLRGQINPKIKVAVKFTFDIWSIPILNTRSDKSFIEQSLHVMPKLVSEFEFQSWL